MKLKTKFQDENFDFGEVVEANIYYGGSGRIKVIAEPIEGVMITFYFESLKGMNEMFEDYEESEESKEYWGIDFASWSTDGVDRFSYDDDDIDKFNKSIGNDFKTEEEAKKAVEKLKALKRLGDHNLRIGRGKRTFVNTDVQLTHQVAMFTVDTYDKVEEDLDLLFPKGGDRWTGKLLD